MSAVPYLAPGVDTTLLRWILMVVRWEVGVANLPLYSMRSPPTVKRIRFSFSYVAYLQLQCEDMWLVDCVACRNEE